MTKDKPTLGSLFAGIGDETKDLPRYRALGNAVCVPVGESIGHRMMETMAAR